MFLLIGFVIEYYQEKRGAYVHLYDTGLMASFLALKRGHSREVAELAEIAGMLHDLLIKNPGFSRCCRN